MIDRDQNDGIEIINSQSAVIVQTLSVQEFTTWSPEVKNPVEEEFINPV